MIHEHEIGDRVITCQGEGIVIKRVFGVRSGRVSIYYIKTTDGIERWMTGDVVKALSALIQLAEVAE